MVQEESNKTFYPFAQNQRVFLGSHDSELIIAGIYHAAPDKLSKETKFQLSERVCDGPFRPFAESAMRADRLGRVVCDITELLNTPRISIVSAKLVTPFPFNEAKNKMIDDKFTIKIIHPAPTKELLEARLDEESKKYASLLYEDLMVGISETDFIINKNNPSIADDVEQFLLGRAKYLEEGYDNEQTIATRDLRAFSSNNGESFKYWTDLMIRVINEKPKHYKEMVHLTANLIGDIVIEDFKEAAEIKKELKILAKLANISLM